MVMTELREVGCQLLTLGQCFSPGENHCPAGKVPVIQEKNTCYGLPKVEAGPLLRSSYKAEALFSGRALA